MKQLEDLERRVVALEQRLTPASPQPEPRPLLADAKVGDLCKRRDGKWVQIDSLFNDRPCPIMCKSDIGGMDYFALDGRNHNSVGDKKDIVHCEPLAAEGTAEWAWQMMLLGKEVTVYDQPNRHLRILDSKIKDSIVHGFWNGKGDIDFKSYAVKTGWQIYEPTKEAIADCDNCKNKCSKQSSGIVHCVDYEPKPQSQPDLPAPEEPVTKCMICNKDAVVDDKTVFLDAKTGKVWHLQCSSDLISGVFASVVSSPQPKVKVGDWVLVEGGKQGKIDHFCSDDLFQDNSNAFVLHDYMGRWYGYYKVSSITRKLDPSEVKVSITLEGTVEQAVAGENVFKLRYGDRIFEYSFIDFTHLTEPDRDLVKSLLDEMEEEK